VIWRGRKTETIGGGGEMETENTVTHVHTHIYTNSPTLTHMCVDSPNPFLRFEKEGDEKL